MDIGKVGRYVFIVGVIIAVLAGLGFDHPQVPLALAVLGVVVGFLNVDGRQATRFLIAGIALSMTASALNGLPMVGAQVSAIGSNIATFVGGAMLVVALKALMSTAQD
jgi:hypothetical protein